MRTLAWLAYYCLCMATLATFGTVAGMLLGHL